jgi:putative PIN family toxin of toxin-antitoxin system
MLNQSDQANPPLLVLDTNVCLDLFVFHDPRWSILLTGLQNGSMKALTSRGCRDEWLAVLHYNHLPITNESRPGIIDAFDKLIICLDPQLPVNIKLPICSDPDDQQFMELARDCKASHLITKDKALLKCAKKVATLGMFQIMSPEAFIKNIIFLFPE